jgi:threonine dehydratase
MQTSSTPNIDRDGIAATERVIRPYIRHTPVLTVDGSDFGLRSGPLAFKLETMQHTGSFKPRGAFANLLTRRVPAQVSSPRPAAIMASPSRLPRCGSASRQRSLSPR